jgi:cytochrome P450
VPDTTVPDTTVPDTTVPPAGVGGCPIRHDFDPLSADYLADPYAVAARVREESPVFYAEGLDMWVVTRMADVEAVFMDHDTFSGRLVQDPVFPLCAAAKAMLRDGGFDPLPTMSNNEPPDHGRIRVFTTKGFSVRRMSMLEPSVRRRANEYAERLLAAGPTRFEFVDELAFPLPAYTVFELIGFPEADADRLKTWCGRRKLFSWGKPSESEQLSIAADMLSYWEYCKAFVEAKRSERAAGVVTDDFVSELLDAHEADATQLTLDELKSVVYGLSFAGHEAVTNLLCNSLFTLLQHPQQWEEVCANRSLVGAAVEEVLRYNSSQISWRRIANHNTTIGGVEIPKGAKIMLLFSSANHDPARFEEPDRFDIHRTNARHHISFGKGVHFCLGAAMARMEAKVVVDVLAERVPSLRLAPQQELRVHPNVQFRGPEELWLEWG